jgi:galactokinase
LLVAAPGRVNLIGEHIDYNDGFVLPLALERYVVIASAPQEKEFLPALIRLHSTNYAESETIRLDQSIQPGRQGWVSYVEGVLAGFIELGENIPAFDAVIGSTVPLGGGLSSSAALEVATATLLEQVTGRKLALREKALLCQKAEHQFAGVPCGIMDQFSSVFGQADELMLIDCRSQKIETVPFDSSDISVLITNSNVKHELTGGEYAVRRSQCDSALDKLDQTTWRDVTVSDLEQRRAALTDAEFRRARHVVSEINRTIEAANAFRNSDWDTAGRLMYASHDSLRDDYEVSCRELDKLVEIASTLGRQGGVIGSRMTGGGFGGCTVSLVHNEQLEAVIDTLTTQYESTTGIRPHCFSSRPARGAHVIRG